MSPAANTNVVCVTKLELQLKSHLEHFSHIDSLKPRYTVHTGIPCNTNCHSLDKQKIKKALGAFAGRRFCLLIAKHRPTPTKTQTDGMHLPINSRDQQTNNKQTEAETSRNWTLCFCFGLLVGWLFVAGVNGQSLRGYSSRLLL